MITPDLPLEPVPAGAEAPALQVAFLTAFAACGNVSGAARAATCHRNTHYWWLRHDPTYAERFTEAKQEALEHLEAEARRRAVEGVEEYLTYAGAPIRIDLCPKCMDEVGVEPTRGRSRPKSGRARRKRVWCRVCGWTGDRSETRPVLLKRKRYSDPLLIFLLKALAPERYRDRAEVRMRGGTRPEEGNPDLGLATLEELERALGTSDVE